MPRLYRLAALLMGLWLAGSVFMDATAINSFRAVDRFLTEPGPQDAALLHEVGPEKARILLRRVAGESNIRLFERWEQVQLGLGLALIVVLVWGSKQEAGWEKILIPVILLMLGLILTSRLVLTPQIARIGRILEFLPPSPPPPERRMFGIYHGISSSLELGKLALGFAVAGILLVKRRRSAPSEVIREKEVGGAMALPRKSR